MINTKRNHSVSRWLQATLGLAVVLAQFPLTADIVHVPAGSTDALSAAVAAAGSGGTVVLAGGTHQVNSTVTVEIPVSIIGEPAAIVESSMAPGDTVAPVLHILGTENVRVAGLAFHATASPIGGVAILIQDSVRTIIQGNAIVSYNLGILIQHGDQTEISDNTLTQIGRHGLISANGQHVRVTGNEISAIDDPEFFPFNGIWLCDVGGECLRNSVSGGWFNGILLCRLPGGPILPDGTEAFAERSATRWFVGNNLSFQNDGGFVVGDGSHHNLLANNGGFESISADIILDGEYPEEAASYENLVTIGSYEGLVVWDYGIDNRVNGAEATAP